MAFRYKIDIMQALKKNGYSSYRLRNEKIFGEKTMTDFRNNHVTFSEDNFEKLCSLLGLDIGDLIEHFEEMPTIDLEESKEIDDTNDEAKIEALPDIEELLP